MEMEQKLLTTHQKGQGECANMEVQENLFEDHCYVVLMCSKPSQAKALSDQ